MRYELASGLVSEQPASILALTTRYISFLMDGMFACTVNAFKLSKVKVELFDDDDETSCNLNILNGLHPLLKPIWCYRFAPISMPLS